MPFIHSLALVTASGKTGWLPPAELGEDAPLYVAFVAPVQSSGDLFDEYSCELITTAPQVHRSPQVHQIRRIGKSLLLEVKSLQMWFNVRPVAKNRVRLSYIGKATHPDFSNLLTEIEPKDPSQLDTLCEKHHLFVVGCDPFEHYAGIMAVKN